MGRHKRRMKVNTVLWGGCDYKRHVILIYIASNSEVLGKKSQVLLPRTPDAGLTPHTCFILTSIDQMCTYIYIYIYIYIYAKRQ